jgi:hypothetical protein
LPLMQRNRGGASLLNPSKFFARSSSLADIFRSSSSMRLIVSLQPHVRVAFTTTDCRGQRHQGGKISMSLENLEG